MRRFLADDAVSEQLESYGRGDVVDFSGQIKVFLRRGEVSAGMIVEEVKASRAQKEDAGEEFDWIDRDSGSVSHLNETEAAQDATTL